MTSSFNKKKKITIGETVILGKIQFYQSQKLSRLICIHDGEKKVVPWAGWGGALYTHALASCRLLQFFTWLYHLRYLEFEHYPSDYLCDEILILVMLNILDFPGDTVQGTWVWSPVQEDPTYHRAAKLMYQSCWAHGLEPEPQLLSPHAAAAEAHAP